MADGTHAELLASTPLYSEVLAQAAKEEATEVVAAEGLEDLGLDSEVEGDVLDRADAEVDLTPEVGPVFEPEGLD